MALSDAIVRGMAETEQQQWLRERQAERLARVRRQRAAEVMAARARWVREARAAETPPEPTVVEREALFPTCLRADCERAGTPHSELLPHQAEGFGASERFIAMLGGYGSAKTQWAVAVGVALTLQIPGNVGFVLRRSYPKLRDSVLRVYLETLERVGVAYETAEHEQGMPLRVVVPATGSEIRFRESTQLSRLLSTECGWFHLEEAWEEPKSTWAHLVGRLRLRGAFGYLKGLITSNPPSHQHWIADVFGLVPGPQRRVDEATGDAFTTRLIQVSSYDNPHLPPGYVAALKTTHAAHDVRRLVEGQYGFVADGVPVYPQFQLARHVRDVPLLDMSIVRAWDFGFRAPAVVWSQFPKCREGRVHWHVVSEYAGRELEAEGLADVVLEQTRAVWARLPQEVAKDGTVVERHGPPVVDVGDAAGAALSDKGPGPIIRLRRAPHHLRFTSQHIPNIDPGLALIRLVLGEADCACGEPTLLVDRHCRHVIDAFAGGYHVRELRPGRSHTEAALKPHKDGFYDNLMDAVRYAAENTYRRLRRDPNLVADLAPRVERATALTRSATQTGPGPWGWMETRHG